MNLIKSLLIAIVAMLVTGCAITPPVTTAENFCGFKIRRVGTELPEQPAHNLFAEGPESILLLSGGGEDGAFGAGLLDEWHKNAGHLPTFSTVTGISTGATAATFAFIDQPSVARRDYDIQKEADIARAFAKVDANGNPTLTSYPSIAKHDALSDLTPLEATLRRDVSMEVLQAVASQYPARRLYVGAVDVDSGDAVEFDMTEMAQRAVASKEAFAKFQPCYVKAIIASAAQPPAAPPEFIDNREYIDGGARFGIFLDDYGLRAGLKRHRPEMSSAVVAPVVPRDFEAVVPKLSAPPTLFIIINGNQTISPACGKKVTTNCGTGGTDPYDNRIGAHKSWSLLPLAMRSSKVLINQIYLFSVTDIYARYAATYGANHDQQYVNDHIKYMAIADVDLNHFPKSGPTCPQQRISDTRDLRVLEFHPNYMRCLIQFGAHYADTHQAALKVETDLAVPAIQDAPPLPPVLMH